jgi:hypothetical protein
MESMESLEHTGKVFRGDSEPTIDDRKPQAAVHQCRAHTDLATVWRILHRVAEQVGENLLEFLSIGQNGRQVGRQIGSDGNCRRYAGQTYNGSRDHGGQIQCARCHDDRAVVNHRSTQDVVEQLAEPL